MNMFQRDTRRYVKAAHESVGAILSAVEGAGIGLSGMREAYDDLNAAHGHLALAVLKIASISKGGGA